MLTTTFDPWAILWVTHWSVILRQALDETSQIGNCTHLAEIRADDVLKSPGSEVDAQAGVPAPDDEDAALNILYLEDTSINDVNV